MTTQGDIVFPDQYAGSWVILFSHPADFTPVCTSEFMTFASLQSKFADLDCKLVGLSIDGLYSHIAWLRTIIALANGGQATFGVGRQKLLGSIA